MSVGGSVTRHNNTPLVESDSRVREQLGRRGELDGRPSVEVEKSGAQMVNWKTLAAIIGHRTNNRQR